MKYMLILLCFTFSVAANNFVIDDKKMRATMNKGIDALKKKNLIADINKLYKQLETNKTCEVNLAPLNKAAMTSKQIFARYAGSVLMIGRAYKCNKCPHWHTSIASGFVISADGIAVTNYHVMDKSRGDAMAAMTIRGQVYAITEVLAADKNADIAIIKLHGGKFLPIPLSNDNGPGTKVTSITHPTGRFFNVTEGIVSRHYMMPGKNRKSVHWMGIDADYAKGSSGGPIFNHKGEIAGMVSSTNSIYYNKENGIDKRHKTRLQ